MLHTNSLKRLVISKLVISVWHLHRITQVFSYFTCSSFLSVICIVLQSFLTRNSKIIISFQIPVVTFVNILQGSIYNIFFLFSVREERSNQPSHLHIVSHECILLLYKQKKKQYHWHFIYRIVNLACVYYSLEHVSCIISIYSKG